jgi:hypothetical protein
MFQVIDRKVASKMSKDVGITRGHGLALKFANEMLRHFVSNIANFIQMHCDGVASVDVTKGLRFFQSTYLYIC